MSTAVAEIDVQPPRSPMAEGFSRLNGGQKARVLAGVVALLAIAIAAIFMGRQPDWRVLFANVNDKDGGAIVAQLATMNDVADIHAYLLGEITQALRMLSSDIYAPQGA